MKIVAAGGGSATDEAEVLAHFTASLGREARVLYVPWAQVDPAAPELASWARATLSAHGVSRVDAAAQVAMPPSGFDAYAGVFIGGGNTYLLLSRLRSTGMGPRLVQAIRGGLPCYGGSAGANVLGAQIGTCAHLDRNEVGVSDLAGLDVFGGRAIWCHYHPEQAEAIRMFVQNSQLEVLAIPENAGVTFDGARLETIGPGRVEVWPARSASG